MESWDSYRRNLQADLDRLESIIDTTLDTIGFQPPAPASLRLLNPACGRCDEAAMLVAAFRKRLLKRHPDPDIRLLGADIRSREIDRARERFPGPQFEFIVADCSRLHGHREIGSNFDVIFVRHQNLWFDRQVWTRLYAGLLDLLAPGGFLMLTSYFDREHMQALALLKELGGELMLSLQNPLSRPLPYPGKSVDRHLAVLRTQATIQSSKPNIRNSEFIPPGP